MSDVYGSIKTGKLKLKGEKKHKKKSKKRDREKDEDRKDAKKKRTQEREDMDKHGGWWAVKEFKHITGPIVIQMKGCYVKSLDDGTFTLGPPHDDGKNSLNNNKNFC